MCKSTPVLTKFTKEFMSKYFLKMITLATFLQFQDD